MKSISKSKSKSKQSVAEEITHMPIDYLFDIAFLADFGYKAIEVLSKQDKKDSVAREELKNRKPALNSLMKFVQAVDADIKRQERAMKSNRKVKKNQKGSK